MSFVLNVLPMFYLRSSENMLQQFEKEIGLRCTIGTYCSLDVHIWTNGLFNTVSKTFGKRIESPGLQSWPWLIGCVTLSKFQRLSGPFFSHLTMRSLYQMISKVPLFLKILSLFLFPYAKVSPRVWISKQQKGDSKNDVSATQKPYVNLYELLVAAYTQTQRNTPAKFTRVFLLVPT